MSGNGLVIFNSWDPLYKAPFGAVKTDQEVVFRLHLSKTIAQEAVSLRLFPIDEEETFLHIPMFLETSSLVTNCYTCKFSHPTPCLMGYYFQVSTQESATLFVKKGEDSLGKLGEGEPWQLTIFHKDMSTPKAFGNGIIYQIFPDRFYNSGTPKTDVPDNRLLRGDWGALPNWRPDEQGEVLNNDYFQGDLLGIERKLDYLSQLGVTLIYLNPIFEAHTNHRYDTGDYLSVDPLLGEEKDFKRLCEAAKERGIGILLDGVFNHTGSDSVYFNKNKRYGEGGAYNDPLSPYYPWYRFTNYPTEYDSWWGFPTLPNVNEEEESYQQFICGEGGVVEKWLQLGASGYRLDVADELPDSFLDALYSRVQAIRPDGAVVGEVWEDASNKISYGLRRRYFLGGQLDSVMNYPFKNAILSYIREGNGRALYQAVLQVLDNYPPPILAGLMNSLSTHDTPRAITALVGEPLEGQGREWQSQHHYLSLPQYEKGKKLLTLAMVLQFGFPGIPCVYYGDEAGLSGYRDPFNRVCYPWDYQDEELLGVVTALGRMRKAHPALASAPLTPLLFQETFCSFLREGSDYTYYFAVNRGDTPHPLDYPIPPQAQCLFTSEGSDQQGLAPLGAVIYCWKS